jgi:hypothetical protein
MHSFEATYMYANVDKPDNLHAYTYYENVSTFRTFCHVLRQTCVQKRDTAATKKTAKDLTKCCCILNNSRIETYYVQRI